MKIAVTATGPELEAKVDPRFGRCPCFLIVETDDLSFEAIENPNVTLGGGRGMGMGRGMGRGRGMGGGRGRGRGMGAGDGFAGSQATTENAAIPNDELSLLKQQAEAVGQQMQQIQQRIKDLEQEKKNG
jgi:hypothetical protein